MAEPKVFVSYAHEDVAWRRQVCKQLQVIARAHPRLMHLWDDQKLRGGDDWRKRLKAELAESGIALLLISDAFLTSDFILKVEVRTFFQLCEKRGTVLYPLLIRPCPWQAVPWLAKKQMRPLTFPEQKALSEFRRPQRERLIATVAREIAEIAGARKRPQRNSRSRGA